MTSNSIQMTDNESNQSDFFSNMTIHLFLLVILLQFKAKAVDRTSPDILRQEVSHLLKLKTLKNDSYIMFWRYDN